MTNARTTKILNHLRTEGYAANVDNEGDITLKYNRLTMILETEDRDLDL